MKIEAGPLEFVATVEPRVTNACTAQDGTLICGFPRWQDDFIHPAVAEVRNGADVRPLLPAHWDQWQPGQPAHEALVSVHALHIDACNQLWILDDGCPKLGETVPGGPKVIQFDLDSRRVVRIYPLAAPATRAASILSHLRSDEKCIYVTDAGFGALVIVDRATGAARRVLDGNPKTQADPSIVPTINGKPYKSAHGKVATLHLSHLEISGDDRWLYFCPLFGPKLQRVPMASLADASKDSAALADEIEFVCDIPPVAGIHAIDAENFLLCAATDGAILHLDVQRRLIPLVTDPRICFPNEGGFAPDRRSFYFPNSGAHLIGRPFEVYRFHLEVSP
ncbi:MAG: L-dopachrome tautomerase-related protein [Pseudomonadota bacterium]